MAVKSPFRRNREECPLRKIDWTPGNRDHAWYKAIWVACVLSILSYRALRPYAKWLLEPFTAPGPNRPIRTWQLRRLGRHQDLPQMLALPRPTQEPFEVD